MQQSTILKFAGFLLSTLLVSTAFGHAGERGFIMLLPTTEWIITGTLVVVATFGILWLAPGKLLSGTLLKQKEIFRWHSGIPHNFLGGLFLFFYLSLIAAGWFGSSDPLVNPVGPVMWSWFWVGMVFLHLLFGNLWLLINPFDAAGRVFEAVWPRSKQKKEAIWPQKLAHWPAVGLLALLTWFENVSLSPYDPATLATAMTVYLMVTLLGVHRFGRRQWMKYGEVFSVYFRMISWLSPLDWRGSKTHMSLRLQWPFCGLLQVGALSLSKTIFVLVALACVTFDGASHTYWWLSVWHINPLEFGGRSTVYWINTLGLFAACVSLVILYGATTRIATERGMADRSDQPNGFHTLAVSLVPIAFGYHVAHYLPAFALESQYALTAVSDPFALGWDLFRTADRPVIASVRSSSDAIETIWTIQMIAIIFSHVISVLIAHLVIERSFTTAHRLRIGQLPYAALMIAYTFVGLWLLSTASL